MKIDSPTRTYTVFARFCGNKRRLIARVHGDANLFLLVIVDSPPLAKQLTPLFMKYREITEFTDFIEFFPYENGFCAVFIYQTDSGGQPLETVIADAPPTLRAATLRSLFAVLLTQNPPYPILRDLLRSENLLCSPSGEIQLTYDLYLTSQYIRHDPVKTMLYLAETVRTICGKPGELYGLLTDQMHHSWPELYAAALRDAEEIISRMPEAEKQSLRARAEALKEKALARAAPVLMLIALAAGYISMAVVFYKAVISPPPPDERILAIGTVILDEENP